MISVETKNVFNYTPLYGIKLPVLSCRPGTVYSLADCIADVVFDVYTYYHDEENHKTTSRTVIIIFL